MHEVKMHWDILQPAFGDSLNLHIKDAQIWWRSSVTSLNPGTLDSEMIATSSTSYPPDPTLPLFKS